MWNLFASDYDLHLAKTRAATGNGNNHNQGL